MSASTTGTRRATSSATGAEASTPTHPGKLFIGGLSFETTDEKLLEYFSQYGQVASAVVMRDAVTKRSRGFGFVCFKDNTAADKAMECTEHVINERRVEAKRAVPRAHIQPRYAQSSQSTTRTVTERGPRHSARKIFVGGLHYDTSDASLREYFEKFGKVDQVQVMYNRETSKSRGFGFVTFESEDTVDKVLKEKRMHEIDSKSVEVKRAVPKSVAPPPRSSSTTSRKTTNFSSSQQTRRPPIQRSNEASQDRTRYTSYAAKARNRPRRKTGPPPQNPWNGQNHADNFKQYTHNPHYAPQPGLHPQKGRTNFGGGYDMAEHKQQKHEQHSSQEQETGQRDESATGANNVENSESSTGKSGTTESLGSTPLDVGPNNRNDPNPVEDPSVSETTFNVDEFATDIEPAQQMQLKLAADSPATTSRHSMFAFGRGDASLERPPVDEQQSNLIPKSYPSNTLGGIPRVGEPHSAPGPIQSRQSAGVKPTPENSYGQHGGIIMPPGAGVPGYPPMSHAYPPTQYGLPFSHDPYMQPGHGQSTGMPGDEDFSTSFSQLNITPRNDMVPPVDMMSRAYPYPPRNFHPQHSFRQDGMDTHPQHNFYGDSYDPGMQTDFAGSWYPPSYPRHPQPHQRQQQMPLQQNDATISRAPQQPHSGAPGSRSHPPSGPPQ